ncbi:thiol reductase thioredoxin [Bacillus methanolicus]|uniref:thioredoxin family protein n=1 Tax=Bacillus methanolicus TaxID=1471 RepID=UPI0023808814|nr:thioredoxin family protein [Bacillus methanolicus]MDE3840038.1 thiol reductase thioredoxin [Bacillus methanolicus]
MKEWTQQDIKNSVKDKKTAAIYFYTPLCGTCQVGGKMLEVVSELLPLIPFGKADLNYMPDLAKELSIESVPCLLLVKDGELMEKIYALRSVPYLLDKIKTTLS